MHIHEVRALIKDDMHAVDQLIQQRLQSGRGVDKSPRRLHHQ